MTERQNDLFDTSPPQWELDAAADQLLATVVFPEAPRGEFDYRVPDSLRGALQLGCRVRVPLGRGNRTLIGYCVSLHTKSTTSHRLKDVKSVVDKVSLISSSILELTKWMVEYYVCPWGPILEAVVPSGVRSNAGTRQITLISVTDETRQQIDSLKLSEKQKAVLKHLVARNEPSTPKVVADVVGCTLAPINSLKKRGLIHSQTRRVHSMSGEDEEVVPRTEPLELNVDQLRAREAIVRHLDAGRYQTILLKGVTGSGKTEVYIQAIEETIRFGRQAIVLVPEISLTPQTCRRFRSRFDTVAVMHSHLSAGERHWQWQRIARGEVQVVVGARSAIFAPVPHLGLIVLDEEHEATFKQDTSPRYHAREVAIQRAERERIPLVLGTATPSLESWHRARSKEYELVEMPRRVLDLPMPVVRIIDLRSESLSKPFRGAISRRLESSMKQALAAKGQVILLLNRRGFSTHIQCPACGEVIRCEACEIALTHHRDGEQAICHYCDFRMPTPNRCPNCSFDGIRFGGLGTQRLEAEVRARFPRSTCLRMDSDTMARHGSHEEALGKFRSGEVQILLGTQMIAKGLDFPNVTLVGVINADTALHLPDFRASERTFQLVTQVAGRTGRGKRGGEVLVQTYSPEHAAIRAAERHDYRAFAESELPIRKSFSYPPFAFLARTVFRGENEEMVTEAAKQMADLIVRRLEQLGTKSRMLGPVPAPIAKLRGQFRVHALVQCNDADALRTALREAQQSKVNANVAWIVDIDPVSML